MTELMVGADRNGFDPFPGPNHWPGPDSAPGPLSAWKPYWSNVEIVFSYAAQVFSGTKDKSLLTLLGQNQIGDRV